LGEGGLGDEVKKDRKGAEGEFMRILKKIINLIIRKDNIFFFKYFQYIRNHMPAPY
jgi:hypothetical protein